MKGHVGHIGRIFLGKVEEGRNLMLEGLRGMHLRDFPINQGNASNVSIRPTGYLHRD